MGHSAFLAINVADMIQVNSVSPFFTFEYMMPRFMFYLQPKPIMAALSNAQPFFEVSVSHVTTKELELIWNVFSFLPLMVCRFILHLRKPKRAASESLWASGNQSFSMRFLGQVRNPLQGGQADEEDSECVDARDIESLDNDSGTICYRQWRCQVGTTARSLQQSSVCVWSMMGRNDFVLSILSTRSVVRNT